MAERVLIIDDDKWIAMSTSMVLEAEGFEVLSSTSGARGLDLAVETRPAVILLDIMMPGVDGWSTLEMLKAHKVTADIPVIVFTARDCHKGRSVSLKRGAAEFFRKPFRPETLVKTIRRHLDLRAASKPA